MRIQFRELLQNSQDLGTATEHLVSRVTFDIEDEGSTRRGMTAVVKQATGSNYLTHPLEVLPPEDYDGPLDYDCFRKCVEDYYRRLIGSSGMGIQTSGSGSLLMRDNRFAVEWACECPPS